jgi:hypothetical protein
VSEDPEAIKGLFIMLDEVQGLGVVEDSVFIPRVLCLMSFVVLSRWPVAGRVQLERLQIPVVEGVLPPFCAGEDGS